MSGEKIQKQYEGLRGRLIQLENVTNRKFESALPSFALLHIENEIDNDSFIKAIIKLLENGVEYFCLSGPNASHLEGIVDDVIISGNFEKVGLFKRKSIPTSFHNNESVNEIADFINIQVRFCKLNPIINVIYDVPSTTVSEWQKILKVA